MICSTNALNLLAAKSYKGIGRAWIVKNWDSRKSVEEIVAALKSTSQESFITAAQFEEKKRFLASQFENLRGATGLVALGDPEFPVHRGRVKNSAKPIYLFYRGDLSLLSLDHINIAVIGALQPDREIEEIERKVVSELVRRSAVVVSGLALGCDSIAHRETLDANGKTVAILPGQLGNILPRSNEPLAEEIVARGGLLISEYWEEPTSKREMIGRYHERDRLQALFSDGIILSASYAQSDKGKDSGSRLAMGCALDYGIPRAVIYDETKHSANPIFNLNRQIIAADKNIVIINETNITSMLETLTDQDDNASQLNLFD